MRPTKRPQDLVFTLFGEYLLHRDGPAWVGGLIALLQPFGLSEGAVRTVLSRMARKGWLSSERVGRHSFYSLMPRGRRLLEEGEARILHPSWSNAWDGTWFLLWYSIPEDVRHLRDRMRDRIAWLGFGSLGNGLWISPHDVEKAVRETARQLGVEGHLECFRGTRLGSAPVTDLVSKCWDLPSVNQHYGAFIDRWRPRLDSSRRDLKAGSMPARRCYTLRFELIHEFRRFPNEDPFLPRALLPDDWAGERASALFHELHDLLVGPADAWVDSVFEGSPPAPAAAEAG